MKMQPAGSGNYVQPGYPAYPQGGYPPPQSQPPYYGAAQPFGQPQPPVFGQPTAAAPGPQIQWMPPPSSMPGCPPGLEYLSSIDQMLVKQHIEMLEVATGIETENKYDVVNTLGQRIFFAREESNMWKRQVSGAARAFTMHIDNNMGQEVIRILRPQTYTCFGPCCACSDSCLQKCEVQAPVGVPIGRILQYKQGCDIRFNIVDESGAVVLQIHGPGACSCNCPNSEIPFNVMSADGTTEVGKICKQATGYLQSVYTDADNFGVTFPIDLSVKVKALMLGAVFLIDFAFFESNPTAERNRRHHHH